MPARGWCILLYLYSVGVTRTMVFKCMVLSINIDVFKIFDYSSSTDIYYKWKVPKIGYANVIEPAEKKVQWCIPVNTVMNVQCLQRQ
jgi:hypothetical protein